MLNEYINIIWRNFNSRKLRSFLTILGIVIGITAIISLITMGNALQDSLTKSLDKFGTRRFFIGPKAAAAGVGGGIPSLTGILTEKDVKTLESLNFVDYVTPVYSFTAKVTYKKQDKYLSVTAYETKNLEKAFADVNIKTANGRWINDADDYAALLGWKIAKKAFEKDIVVGNSVYIEDVKFKVVGIKEEQGDQGEDYSVNIPLSTAQKIKQKPGAISAIVAQVKEGVDMDEAEKKIVKSLKRARNAEDFVITTPKKIQAQIKKVLSIVTYVVTGIAFIALVVGALGIMNSMYTSVLERTNQIGIMKAIGARKRDILIIFLLESGIVGLFGGIVGIIIGVFLSYSIATIINFFDIFSLKISISWSLILFSLLFSFLLGTISGLLPAIRAANLKPIEALRYE